MRVLLFLLDFIVFTGIVLLTVALRYGELTSRVFEPTGKVLFPVFLFSSIILWVFSFYDLNSLKKKALNYRNVITAFAISFPLSATFIYFLKSFFNVATPKLVLFGVFIFYFSYVYLSRKIYTSFTFKKTRLLLLGKSNTLKEIAQELPHHKNYDIAAKLKNAEDAQNIKPESIDLIIMGNNILSENLNAWPILSTHFLNRGVHLITDYDFYEYLFTRSSKGSIKNDLWLLRGVAARQEERFYPTLKRAMDILFCLILIIPLTPVAAFIWTLIRLIDGVEPVFIQKRIGKLEKDINIYKFRTMYPGTENITKFGKQLRRFRLDEIPQLINILRGDISIVGPRPLAFEDYKAITDKIPAHSIRNIIKPGLTGWAQINFKAPPNYSCLDSATDEVFLDAALTRLAYDIWYIKNRSFFLDIEIILKTAKRAFIKDKNIE